ncbi:MAG: Uma2 family endonuclease [Planctomycetota bacterium]|nr:Uma2 family endonuclease [Planctomycetota bacterium]
MLSAGVLPMTTIQNRRRFTVDDYYRMAAAGILKPSDRVELIEGEIVEMSPIGFVHAAVVDNLTMLFARAFGKHAIVRIQSVLRLSELSEPQPDALLLKPHRTKYKHQHPGPQDVLLLVEVSDTTLGADREKAALYAAAGIQEYWIVNIPDRQIEVHRSPVRGGYRSVRAFKKNERVTAAALDTKSLKVSQILD